MSGEIGFRERIAAIVLMAAVVGAGAFAFKTFKVDPRVTMSEPIAAPDPQPTSTESDHGSAALVSPAGASNESEPTSSEEEPEATAQDTAPAAQDWSWDHKPIDKYLTFLTPQAEDTVRSFQISCPQPGKTIRLIDAMRAGLRMGSSYKGAHLYMTVDSRGDEVRIINQVRLDDGRSNTPHVVATINRWGELQLQGISEEGIMDQCYL